MISKELLIATGVNSRPDLLKLQVQMVRKFVTPAPSRYLVFCDPSSNSTHSAQSILEATTNVCEEYGAELIRLNTGLDRNLFRKLIADHVRETHDGYVLLIEDDVMPIEPIELTETTFARFFNGVLVSQLQYRPAEWEFDDFYLDYENKFEIKYEARRCRDEDCLPEQVRGLGFDESLNAMHEFYGPFIHYDRASLSGYEHESDAKDKFFNEIVKRFGLSPFKRSFAKNIPLSQRQIDAVGPDIYRLSSIDIVYAMKNPKTATIGDMMSNIKEATVRAATAFANGEILRVPKEVYEKRMSICERCSLYDVKLTRCTHRKCGCFLKAKARMTTETCPMDRWDMDEDELLISDSESKEEFRATPEQFRATPEQQAKKDDILEFRNLIIAGNTPTNAAKEMQRKGMFASHDEHSMMRVLRSSMEMNEFSDLMRKYVMPSRIVDTIRSQCLYLEDVDDETYGSTEDRVLGCLRGMRK